MKGKICYKPLKQGPCTEKTHDFRTRLGNEGFFTWYFSTLLGETAKQIRNVLEPVDSSLKKPVMPIIKMFELGK